MNEFVCHSSRDIPTGSSTSARRARRRARARRAHAARAVRRLRALEPDRAPRAPRAAAQRRPSRRCSLYTVGARAPTSPTTAHAELSTCDTDAPAANHSTPATSNAVAPSPPDGTSDHDLQQPPARHVEREAAEVAARVRADVHDAVARRGAVGRVTAPVERRARATGRPNDGLRRRVDRRRARARRIHARVDVDDTRGRRPCRRRAARESQRPPPCATARPRRATAAAPQTARTDASEWSIDPGPWSDSKSKRTRLPLPPSYAQYTLRYSTPPTVVDAPSSCAIRFLDPSAPRGACRCGARSTSRPPRSSCLSISPAAAQEKVSHKRSWCRSKIKAPRTPFSDSWHVANCPFASNDSDDTLSM